MRFRGDTTTDDWAFGKGKQSYLSDNLAIARNIATRLRYFYSECFFDTQRGVPWFDLLGQKDQDRVVLAIKREIYDCYGVTNVTEVRYTLDSSRNLTIRYWIDTMYSRGVQGSVTV